GATTLADIAAADWSLKLGAVGEVVEGIRDVEQCLAIILTTPKGADVLRPTFGADLWRYIDNPISAAIPAIVREVSAAIAMWEPRVKLLGVRVSPVNDGTAQSGAHLNLAITWQLKLGAASQQSTSISIAGGT
ncbi:MAG TPA: GPW/gp25 family protein, partial [Candidatus Binataceae bacterium]|nr:GPW/gp25 family protein [Candidatus Binataceae bacterium]